MVLRFFQFLKRRKDTLLLSICSPSSRQKSGGIGTVNLSDLTQPTNSMYMYIKLYLGSAVELLLCKILTQPTNSMFHVM